MATAIKIPDLGTTVDYVKVVTWLKKENDPVRRGDPLCEVETDKAVSELESVAEGVLLKRLVAEGTEVEQGTVVAYVGEPGESVPAAAPPAPAAAAAPFAAAPTAGAGVKASPIVRNLAKSLGVDISGIAGTGAGGMITREDVLKAKEGGGGTVSSIPAAAGLSAHQSSVARRVAQSHREIPPINLIGMIEMSAAQRRRRHFEQETGRKPSYDALFLHAVAVILKDFPHFRSAFDPNTGRVTVTDAVHLGIALSPGENLYTPVIHHADRKSLEALEAAVRELSAKAEQGRFKAEELEGATFTISNLGMYPVRAFVAIIPPGHAAALAIGAVEEHYVVRDGQPVIAPLVSVTLSVDHRLINGREAGEFLARLKGQMETL